VRYMEDYPSHGDDPTLYFRPAAYSKILVSRGQEKKK